MVTFYELRRRLLKSGAFKKVYANRLVDSEGQTLFEGKTRYGYITSPVTFNAVDFLCRGEIKSISFGGNRRIAPSVFELKDGGGKLIATIKTGIVQSAWNSKPYSIKDAQGKIFLHLVPAESFKNGFMQKLGPWARDDLVLMQDERVIGHTGQDPGQPEKKRSAGEIGKKLATDVAKLSMQLSGILVKSFQEEFMGKTIDRPE